MGWQDLLSTSEKIVLPWVGGRRVFFGSRSWRVRGPLPREFGWYSFDVDGGRETQCGTPAEVNPDFETRHKQVQGYIVGDRMIPDGARVDPDPAKLVDQTLPVFLVEPGLDHFARATACITENEGGERLVFIRQGFPHGPEADVEVAYQDRKQNVDHIPGVTPALDLAFRWLTYQRGLAEERERLEALRRAEEERLEALRRAEEERRKEAAGRLQQALKDSGTGAGRRVLAGRDFKAAARAALAISGAELLDSRPSYNRGEMVVQYRYQHRRLECVVDAQTLRIIDAGVCLDDHKGTKGDTFFTLESLPVVIAEALRLGKLVVWRHVPGDVAGPARNWDPDEDDDD